MSGSRMRISVWRFCESVSPWQTSLNSSKKLSEKRNVIYYWWLSSRLYNSLTLQIMFAVAKTQKKNTHSRTYWMYLSETFWLCLVVMVRMYICSAASRSAASYFSSGPNRSKHTSLQLCGEKVGKQSFHENRQRLVFRACEERFICPPSSSGSRSASSLSWMKFSAFVARESFKGIQFPVLDEGLGSAKRWNLTGEKKKKMGFSPPRLLDVTNYQKNPMGKREVIYRGAAVVEDFIC